jgi:hypothetical protein
VIRSTGWTVVVAFAVLATVLVAGCGGGEDGSSTNEETSVAAEASEQHGDKAQHHHHQKHHSIEQERLERSANEKFLKEEEGRVLEEEASVKRSKHRRKLREKESQPVPQPASPAVASITTEEFHGFNTEPDHGNWEIAYSVCAVTPEKQLAKEFHTEQNFGAIGHAYGSGYREPFNIAADEGCMAALVDSEAEREAAFKMMEEDE